MAYAYFFSGDAAYAVKAAAILRTWFLAPATRMNPDLTYAQGVPGASTGQPGGIIDTADLPLVLDAAHLLDGSPAWTAADHTGLQAWVGGYLDLAADEHGRTGGSGRHQQSRDLVRRPGHRLRAVFRQPGIGPVVRRAR